MSKVYSNIRLFSRIIYRAATCLVALFIFTATASAATYTVDTTADSAGLTACTAAPNDCSLRGAVVKANATVDNDSIGFAAGINTITLTLGEIIINDAATAGALTIINSTGASNLLISGNNASRVFSVYPGANLTLNAVTVTRGNTPGIGGGIINYGTTTLLNSTVSGNAAGDGGGIYNFSGTVSLTNSTVSGNTASTGGGISNDGGATTLLNSTVSGNTSTSDAGGIFNNSSGTVSLTNSTVSGNRAQNAGGIFSSGTLNLTGVTVAYNIAQSNIAGGVYVADGTANLLNTIVAKNSAFDGPDFYGAISSTSSFNLIGDGTQTAGITNGTNGNQIGAAANPIDPKLDPVLALNGGTTLNHALLTGSPAIDQGSAAGTDQRGLTRPADNPSIPNAAGGNGADIGAFEVQFAPTAAAVSIGGSVTVGKGRALRNARVYLTERNGETRLATTSAFGYYRFADIAAGQTVIITIVSKRYQFAPQMITVTEDQTELNFTAQ